MSGFNNENRLNVPSCNYMQGPPPIYTGQQQYMNIPPQPMMHMPPIPGLSMPPRHGMLSTGEMSIPRHRMHLPPDMPWFPYQDIYGHPSPPFFRPPFFPRQPTQYSAMQNPGNFPIHGNKTIQSQSQSSTATVQKPETINKNSPDTLWLKNFTDKVKSKIKNTDNDTTVTKNSQDFTICQAKQLHQRAHEILNSLEKVKDKTKHSTFSEHSAEIQSLKNELDEILCKLSDIPNLKQLESKIKCRRMKRKRMQKNRKEEYLKAKELEAERNSKQEKITELLLSMKEKEERQKKEKEVQKELDRCLQDVKQKQNELKKLSDLLNSLMKLRKARRESAVRKGQQPEALNDELFSSAFDAIKIQLDFSTKECYDEEKSLRQFLSEEQKKQEEEAKRKRILQEKEKEEWWRNERWEILFGPQEELDAFDPLWPIQEMHKQADCSLISLYNIRQQWDHSIVQNRRDGSRIPSRWVEPAIPSSNLWEQYCSSDRIDEEMIGENHHSLTAEA